MLLNLHLKNQSYENIFEYLLIRQIRKGEKISRNLALQEMQGYQWDSHHQHHAPAQAYSTAKQMEGKSLQSRKFSFNFLTSFGVRLKRKYPLPLPLKCEISPVLAAQNCCFISRKISPTYINHYFLHFINQYMQQNIYNAALGNFS